ncbi:uncharacterized protein SPPG_05054 [Spizellomyces punctatus DAOM BR117]|uniref:Protein OS-9 homolog n=1 Tax=Spizellomyces punctatus (strain DAOM BR117) TaxID=645134 RepID=A0A0L0HF00_SPIPD|nr:uncharacterized protein SPPG_05054 [Spizellomyces punctatus DAOM BR117]KNC99672.1 hypothetical protein SPPG_05054 [Spizellomyces punctatus DAOM BR117]|eukprot:XP_016607712.1 hypothetical protein SPPG_05054 [Spizellomyces punctatus DAOM BR117]
MSTSLRTACRIACMSACKSGLGILLLLLLLLTPPPTQALSTADVYHDLFAEPQYQILIGAHSEQLFPADTQHATDAQAETLILQGKEYVCSLPRTTEKEDIPQDARDVGAVLNGLGGKCLHYMTGYWSYEFCPQKWVRQYHAVTAQEESALTPAQRTEIANHNYVIGLFDGSSSSSDVEVVKYESGGRHKAFLRMRWRGGTICELSGVRREVVIEVFCNPATPYDHISQIQETSTCKYLLTVHTPRLCADPLFNPHSTQSIIHCNPISTPHMLDSGFSHPTTVRTISQKSRPAVKQEVPKEENEKPLIPDVKAVIKQLGEGLSITDLAEAVLSDWEAPANGEQAQKGTLSQKLTDAIYKALEEMAPQQQEPEEQVDQTDPVQRIAEKLERMVGDARFRNRQAEMWIMGPDGEWVKKPVGKRENYAKQDKKDKKKRRIEKGEKAVL